MSGVLGVGKAIEKLIDPVAELVKKVAGPAAEEVGLSFQDSVKVWRAKRAYKLFQKMNGFIADSGFEPKTIALKTLLPALDFASTEDDENLHTAWAALLANAADPSETNRVLPVFPIILRELTALDARFLDNFYERFHGKNSDPNGTLSVWNSIPELEELYPREGLHVQPLDELTPEEQSAPGYLAVTLDTLERNNVIARTYLSSNFPPDPLTDMLTPVYSSYVLTSLGMMFVRACRAPQK